MKKFLYTFILVLILNSLFLIQNSSAQWGPDVRLTNAADNSSISYNNAWCVAASGTVVHTVWYDNRDGNPEIYYKHSLDGGTTWGTDVRLTNNSANSYAPGIAVSGLLVHVVWGDNRDGFSNYEIYYKRSTDGGLTWGADTRLTNSVYESVNPSITVSGSNVHVVWFDYRDNNGEIYYKRSSDGGLNWETDTRLTNNTTVDRYPSISFSGSNLHVVWHNNRDTNWEIYYKSSTDGGLTWGADTRLTNNSALSEYPSIAVSGTLVHVVWRDARDGNNEIYYKRSTDGGLTWGADTRLTNNSELSEFPSIAVSGSNVHLVWYDTRDLDTEIYYKLSTDAGVTWGTDTRLTNNPGFSYTPSIAVSGSNIHLVWSDTRDGNNEIYYKRTVPPIPIAPTLISPPNNATNQVPNLLLDWSAVQYAVSYKIQIANDSLFTSMVFDTSNVNRDSLRVRLGLLIVNTKYFWRVNATNVTGTGPWSTVWNFRISPVGLSISENVIPDEFKLYNNYPNPFNPVTKIRFAIPLWRGEGGRTVSLKVYDVMGREVQTLVSESLKPGTYETTFDGSQLTSGVYFYKIVAGDFVETKKMLIIK